MQFERLLWVYYCCCCVVVVESRLCNASCRRSKKERNSCTNRRRERGAEGRVGRGQKPPIVCCALCICNVIGRHSPSPITPPPSAWKIPSTHTYVYALNLVTLISKQICWHVGQTTRKVAQKQIWNRNSKRNRNRNTKTNTNEATTTAKQLCFCFDFAFVFASVLPT